MKHYNALRVVGVVATLLVNLLSWLQYDQNFENEAIAAFVQRSEAHQIIARGALESNLDRFDKEITQIAHLIEIEREHDHLPNENEMIEFYESVGTLYLNNHDGAYQFRIILPSGQEITRIEREGIITSVVPAHQLQNKATRYYFKEALNMEPEDTYFSPIDLNVEQGAVVQPIQPTIRVVHKILDPNQQTIAMVVVNYELDSILGSLDQYSRFFDQQLLLLNKDGYWLIGTDPDKEWGFMFPNKQNMTLVIENETLWNALVSLESGEINMGQEWYRFSRFYMTPEEPLYFLYAFDLAQDFDGAEDRGLMALVHILVAIGVSLTILLGTRMLRERMKTREKLNEQAYFDVLTKVPNRLNFMRTLNDQLENAQPGDVFAIFFLDLDGFKSVNDKHGHEVGDKVLISVASRLQRILRESDTVFRLGGDEFTLLIRNVKTDEDLDVVADKVINAISHRYVFDDIVCEIGVSIGISLYPRDGNDANRLINIADDFMYEVKRSGKNNYQYRKADEA